MTRWSPVDEIFVNDRHASPLTDHLNARSVGSCASIRNYCSYVIVYWNGSWRNVVCKHNGIENAWQENLVWSGWMFYIWLGRISNGGLMLRLRATFLVTIWRNIIKWIEYNLYNGILTGSILIDSWPNKFLCISAHIDSSFFFYYKLKFYELK